MPASLIAAGDALARFFAAPEIGSVPHRSARQGILILVAFIGGMLPISNMAMLSSAYLALSGDFNADLIDLGRLALGNLLIKKRWYRTFHPQRNKANNAPIGQPLKAAV